jgi:23S rRNA (guanosine2251-2'-O)-methyltransferase
MPWSAGIHAVETALAGGSQRVRRLLVDSRRRDQRMRRLVERAERNAIPVERVDRASLDRQVPGQCHQGVCAEVVGTGVLDERGLVEHIAALAEPMVLVLDGVQDPHNLGACLRSAEAAGAQAVVVPRDRAARITTTVERSSAGASARIPLAAVTNLARALAQLREAGCWVVGTDDAAEAAVFERDLSGALALVLGSEGRGLRRRTRAACDEVSAIPMAGRTASLNVSVAAGICLFEAVRQRRG